MEFAAQNGSASLKASVHLLGFVLFDFCFYWCNCVKFNRRKKLILATYAYKKVKLVAHVIFQTLTYFLFHILASYYTFWSIKISFNRAIQWVQSSWSEYDGLHRICFMRVLNESGCSTIVRRVKKL